MCDTLAVVKPQGVLFAKNSDRDPNEAQRLEWHPRRRFDEGEALKCTYLTIPQVRETNAVLLSRPFWMWGAEMGANEHGVCIGNEAVWTRQPYAEVGLTGMDMLRLALERSSDAQSAVAVLLQLLDTHGQGGGCGYEDRSVTYHNSFLVADAAEAYVVETAGRHHATERITDGARSISNLLTIEDFASTHANPDRLRVNGAAQRRSCTQQGAQQARNVADLMAVLRDHGAGRTWPHYEPHNGAMSAPCMHAGGDEAASQTTASWISEVRRDCQVHWVTACAAPCLSLYLPVRIDDPVDLGSPTDVFDAESYWWQHEQLHRSLIRDPEGLGGAFLAERDALQDAWLRSPPTTRDAVHAARAFYARWLQRAQALTDRRPEFIRAYWQPRNARAGLDQG